MSEHMHKADVTKSRSRNVVSYIFSFFLAIDVLLITLLIVLSTGLFSERSLISALDGNYYSYVLDYVESETNYYTLPTGINPSVLTDVFTLENIQINTNKSVTNAINGVKFTPDVTSEREKLMANVTASFLADGVSVSEGSEGQKIAEAYVNEIMDIYTTAIEIPGLEAIAKVQDTFSKVLPIALAVLVVLAIVFIIVLIRLHHYIHRSLRYVAYATGGAGLMIAIVPFILQITGYYNGLNLQPQYFYYFCVSVISRVLRFCLIGGAVLIITTILIAVMCSLLRPEVRHSHRHH